MIAVAPLPMTVISLPEQSRSSGQCWGWINRPANFSTPGNSGV
ncbi:Uncharacterised protein [Mycobacteroides abscessus subsp. abscessus]|nr:Uncharacterised protein [Mycobacteroides abscessus subsp. abscessus]